MVGPLFEPAECVASLRRDQEAGNEDVDGSEASHPEAIVMGEIVGVDIDRVIQTSTGRYSKNTHPSHTESNCNKCK